MNKPQSKPSHLQLVTTPPPPLPEPAPQRWRLRGGLAAVVVLGAVSAGAYVGRDRATVLPAAEVGAEADPSEPPFRFEVYTHIENAPTTPRQLRPHDSVRRADGYTFVMHNRTQAAAWLMVLGVDHRDRISWIYPVADPEKQHASIPLAASPVVALPEAVSPAIDPGELQIVALVTQQPLTVAAVEAAYARGGVEALSALPGAQVMVQSVDVEE